MTSPYQLAEEKLTLSGEYERLSELLSHIDIQKPQEWIRLKSESKSDKEATMKWEMTEQGQNEITIRSRLKAIEKKISGISSMLRVLEAEARNQAY